MIGNNISAAYKMIQLTKRAEEIYSKFWRHDIKHNDIQHNDIQHKGLIYDTQHT